MNLDKQKKQNPEDKEIKLILELFNLNKHSEAEKKINQQLLKYPNSWILFNILGAVLVGQDKLEQGIENYKKSIEINPKYAQAYNNLGVALHRLDKLEESVTNIKKALDLKKDFAEAFNNLGNLMKAMNKTKDSLKCFEKAIKISPNYAEAYNSLGGAYQDLGKTKEAMKNFQEAIKIKPNYVDAHNNLGISYTDLAKYDEAFSSYEKAIELDINFEKSYNNLGNLLSAFGKYEEATDKYRKAIKIKPDYRKAYSNLLFNLNYEINLDTKIYLEEAKKFGLNCRSKNYKMVSEYKYQKEPNKLKLGFVTSDFGNHPGGYFSLSTLRELKKKNFELIAYSNYDRKDEYVHNFWPLFEKWHSIEKKKDKEVVEQILEDGIHILIEMQGHSAANRIPVFMYKPAPIQISWLSQGTLGVPEIDYLIGSPHITPLNEENHFIEKILRLPEITQCFTPPDFDTKVNSLPAINNNFITFGSLNKLTKINDDVITLWSKILLSVPKSKLILKSREFDNQSVVKDLINKFKKHNIDNNRLILQGKSKTRKEVFEVYNEIDIALDPFPFQGNTSSCEAIWMGVPVITLKGNRLLFHFGESINSNLKMNNWIAENKDEYVLKAIKFSKNLNDLSKIRANLRETAIKSPVFDAKRFSENFSELMWKVWIDYKNNKNK